MCFTRDATLRARLCYSMSSSVRLFVRLSVCPFVISSGSPCEGTTFLLINSTYQTFLIGSWPGSLYRLGPVTADTCQPDCLVLFQHATSAAQYPTAGIPTAVFQSLVVALVLSRLDYCNSVLVGLPANLIRRLQSVQRTRQHGSFTGYGVPSISQTRSLAFTGFAFRNASCSRSP